MYPCYLKISCEKPCLFLRLGSFFPIPTSSLGLIFYESLIQRSLAYVECISLGWIASECRINLIKLPFDWQTDPVTMKQRQEWIKNNEGLKFTEIDRLIR